MTARDTRYPLTPELTLSLLMSYIYGAPCKARNVNVIIIIIIIINIKGWAIWPVSSPELQLLSPAFLRSPNRSLSLWAVAV
jgi:hypothetical protein